MNVLTGFSNFRLVTLLAMSVLIALPTRGQTKTQATGKKGTSSPEASTQEKNIQAYINLVRVDVRQQKAEIMGTVMLLSAEDAAKFWPIYNRYDAQLANLDNQRLENIKEYARTYTQLTDAKATRNAPNWTIVHCAIS